MAEPPIVSSCLSFGLYPSRETLLTLRYREEGKMRAGAGQSAVLKDVLVSRKSRSSAWEIEEREPERMKIGKALRRLNESGQRAEALLRTAAEKMEAAETILGEQFQKEGLVAESDGDADSTIDQS